MKVAAFFDMDGTLLRGESQFAFLLWLMRRRLIRLGGTLHVLGMYSMYLSGFTSDARRLRKAGFGLLSGNSNVEISNMGEEFFRSRLAKRLRRFAENYVDAHREAGHRVVLVTSAADIVARPVARHFRFDAVVATQLELEGDTLTGGVEAPEPFMEGKRDMVEAYCQQNGFAVAECFAYTDHHSDVSLLQLVGNPRVVNPTKKLREMSVKCRWSVVNFDEPPP